MTTLKRYVNPMFTVTLLNCSQDMEGTLMTFNRRWIKNVGYISNGYYSVINKKETLPFMTK